MFDGINICARIDDFSAWKAATGIEVEVATNLDTGVIRTRESKGNVSCRHYGMFETYKLTVIETVYAAKKTQYLLLIDGSLHKNYFKGENYKRFTFDNCMDEISELCNAIHLPPNQCRIQALELGANLPVNFVVKDFILNNVLLHQTKEFVEYDSDKNGFVLGRLVKHSQHVVKCYDKGSQFDLDYELMRFEERCTKMQYLQKYGLRTLEDLQSIAKASNCLQLLLNAWDNVLIYEPGITTGIPSLKPLEKDLLNHGQYRGYWTKLHTDQRQSFNKKRTLFRELMNRYSPVKTHRYVRELIVDEWEKMLRGVLSIEGEQISSLSKG